MEGPAQRKAARASRDGRRDNAEARHDVACKKNHETFLGRLHYIIGRYDDSDILLFDCGLDEKSILVVRVKRPYRIEALAKKVAGILA